MGSVSDRQWVIEKVRPYGKVIDIGAGPLTTLLAKKTEVTCVDLDEDAIEEERENAYSQGVIEKVKFENQDALSTEYGDKEFDFAFSYGTLHHIDVARRYKFLEEMARISKVMVIADFNEEGFPHDQDEFEIVDFGWLKKTVNSFGKVKNFNTNYTFLFVVEVE